MIEDAIRDDRNHLGTTRATIKNFIAKKYELDLWSVESQFSETVKMGQKAKRLRFMNANNSRIAIVGTDYPKMSKKSKAFRKKVQTQNVKAKPKPSTPTSKETTNKLGSGGSSSKCATARSRSTTSVISSVSKASSVQQELQPVAKDSISPQRTVRKKRKIQEVDVDDSEKIDELEADTAADSDNVQIESEAVAAGDNQIPNPRRVGILSRIRGSCTTT
ncbi:hypothetical protein BGW38_005921 [Lunasporangiospora selenospora]|uniref:H15 domain-containing protein n=1 Tax=Lunasporangiospora selenospora TaxID=979761 RepID=A0A9P6FPB4_9FUNG|nr:hypothetical protein BGW38_005921 [Lunasporangiospora selenospora]